LTTGPRGGAFFYEIGYEMEWGTMDSSSAILRIIKLLNEAKTEASNHELRTLTYFIDMALIQAHDEASKPDTGNVESHDTNKKVG
jgi:hypothetical protein